MELEKIFQAIYSAFDELGPDVSKTGPLVKAPETLLFGSGGALDSLGLINLIYAVENLVEEHFNSRITLADERAMTRATNPFRSVKALGEYIAELLAEASHE